MNLLFYSYYLADRDIEKVDADWSPLKLKQWVKGDSIRGTFTLPTVGGKVLSFGPQDRDRCLQILWRSMAHQIVERIDEPHALIPVPGHSALVGHAKPVYRTWAYAEAVAASSGGKLVAFDGLRWRELRDPQRGQSGFRHASARYQNLELVGAPGLPAILLDDVCTSGATLTASAWLLEDAGVKVSMAAAVARPTHQRIEPMTTWRVEPLEEFTRPLRL